tara:strand:- start:384 stop:530 length:147 start_codon:yes stop_codon:yes gene_type:complete
MRRRQRRANHAGRVNKFERWGGESREEGITIEDDGNLGSVEECPGEEM